MQSALPLWWEKGADPAGGFYELLGQDGEPVPAPRRARVQARQSYVFAMAGALGWDGPWRQGAEHGLAFLDKQYLRPSGWYCTEVAESGQISKPDEMLYDQAFVLMAGAHAARLLPERRAHHTKAAHLLLGNLAVRRHPQGGFRELGARPFLSNPHMHLFEAALAWFETEGDDIWKRLGEEIADLCLTRLIRGQSLREYFDEHWQPSPGADGRSVEPGHQFEWAWLLERWSRIAAKPEALGMARTLFMSGMKGVDAARNVAIDEMDEDFAIRRPTARLWVQTERLKAALSLSSSGQEDADSFFLDQADRAAAGLWAYLETPRAGLWRDVKLADGNFVDQPAPASSFYHIICAIDCLGSRLGR